MMKENEIATLIEWGKEEKQSEFVEFVNFCVECRANRKIIIVEMDGEIRELPLEFFSFDYRKPFDDFDFIIFPSDFRNNIRLLYTSMNLIKKIGENIYHVETTKGKSAIIRLKEGQ